MRHRLRRIVHFILATLRAPTFIPSVYCALSGRWRLIALLLVSSGLLARRRLVSRRLRVVSRTLTCRLVTLGAYSQSSVSLLVNLPSCLQTLLALENNDGLARLWTEHTINLDRKALLFQDKLDLAYLFGAQVNGNASLATSLFQLGATTCSNRDNCNDGMAAINDDDLLSHHEILVPAPFGMNFDERNGNLDNADTSGDDSPDSY